MIKVLVNGANGRMGQTAITAINHVKDLTLAGTTGREDDLKKAIKESDAAVVIDLTVPDAVFKNAKTIIDAGAHPVIGTSGLTDKEQQTLIALCAKAGLGGVIAPNFSLGAILMMKYARDAAQYYKHAEIVEYHHDKKIDAPSGTALHTAEQMQRPETPIHSVRLPGLFAHQEVIFGGPGETLKIRHDAIDRSCMMPGILLACRKVVTLDHMVLGLEKLIVQ